MAKAAESAELLLSLADRTFWTGAKVYNGTKRGVVVRPNVMQI